MFLGSKRKNYLINKKFQLSFMMFSGLTSLCGMSIFFISVKYFFWSFESMGKEFGIPADHIFFRFINDQNHRMNVLFLVSSIIFFLFSLGGSLLLSHRVAGPIYRMTLHLKNASGKQKIEEVKDIKFRNGDFFLELQDAFNEFLKQRKKEK